MKAKGFSAAVLTVSDSRAGGQRPDLSGVILERLLKAAGAADVAREAVPDERGRIAAALIRLCDRLAARSGGGLIITTGGTGLAPRDLTPEATLDVIERLASGFAEAMRAASLSSTPLAMLSRGVSGIRGTSLIINFPGSPRACEECFAAVAPALGHALRVLSGESGECAGT